MPLRGPAVTQDSLAARSATRVAAGPNDSQWTPRSHLEPYLCTHVPLSETRGIPLRRTSLGRRPLIGPWESVGVIEGLAATPVAPRRKDSQ